MLLVKTPEGQQAFKQRDARMGPRQRSAFLLFDGQRSLGEVLEATGGLGITETDIAQLQAQGFLQLAGAVPGATGLPAIGAPLPPQPPAARSDQERYRDAYPIAIALTGALGLKGFRLNLAVEGATHVDGLVALAPRIRQAVGEDRFALLEAALFD